MHKVLVNRLGGLSLPRKSVVRLTDRPDMTLDVYRGRTTTIQQQYNNNTTVSYVFPLLHICTNVQTGIGVSVNSSWEVFQQGTIGWAVLPCDRSCLIIIRLFT